MRRVLGLSTVGLLALALMAASPPQEHRNASGKSGLKGTKIAPLNNPGIVTYDPGAPADTFLTANSFANYVGNVFNSKNGNPLSPGTVYAASWYHGEVGFAPTGRIAFGAPTAGNLNYVTVSPLSPMTFNAFSFSPFSVGSAFFGGLGLVTGSIGVRSASVNGQGFHGRRRAFSGGTTVLSGQNVMFRVRGDILIPVELMEFSVE